MSAIVRGVIAAALIAAPFTIADHANAAPSATQCNAIIHRAKLTGHDELQPAGVTASARWGWGAELDARVTADGKVVLVHDDTLKRITGGADTRAPETLTFAEVTAVPLANGGRVIGLWAGLRAAKKAGVKVMLETKRYPQHKDAWDDAGHAYVARAIAATKMTRRAFVGGSGAGVFHQGYPGHRGFVRVSPGDPQTAAGIDAMTWHPDDLIQLDATHYRAGLVTGLRGLGHGVASRNAFTLEQVAAGLDAGLRTFQEDRGGRLRNHCKEATR